MKFLNGHLLTGIREILNNKNNDNNTSLFLISVLMKMMAKNMQIYIYIYFFLFVPAASELCGGPRKIYYFERFYAK